jgi:threonine/homoserine/homoserine lactone efflux protein
MENFSYKVFILIAAAVLSYLGVRLIMAEVNKEDDDDDKT